MSTRTSGAPGAGASPGTPDTAGTDVSRPGPPRPGPTRPHAARAFAGRTVRAASPRLADRRGLTALGATVLALLLGALGGSVDVLTGRGLGTAFGICFVLGCGAAALAVHREDLRAAVVMPPLAYVVLALAGGTVDGVSLPGSLATRSALELANALALGAPVVLSATALSLVVVLGRAVSRT